MGPTIRNSWSSSGFSTSPGTSDTLPELSGASVLLEDGLSFGVPAETIPGQSNELNIQLLPEEPPGGTGAPMGEVEGSRGNTSNHIIENLIDLNEPHLVILEQPAARKFRFRYETDGNAGHLQGANSTDSGETFPKIKICGHTGKATVVVSCVTNPATGNPKAHPHILVSPARIEAGQDRCDQGICTQKIRNPDMTHEFKHLSIQCKKKNEIKTSLEKRKELRVDPYREGWEHTTKFDLNVVKLCFQAFITDPDQPGKLRALDPVCSKPIQNKKTHSDLQIVNISDDEAPAKGGKLIIILCEKILKNDVKVRFFNNDNTWQAYGMFRPEGIHHQYAIPFRTPACPESELKNNEQMWIELVKENGDRSDSIPFTFTPEPRDVEPPVPVAVDFRALVAEGVLKEESNGGSLVYRIVSPSLALPVDCSGLFEIQDQGKADFSHSYTELKLSREMEDLKVDQVLVEQAEKKAAKVIQNGEAFSAGLKSEIMRRETGKRSATEGGLDSASLLGCPRQIFRQSSGVLNTPNQSTELQTSSSTASTSSSGSQKSAKLRNCLNVNRI